MAEGRAGPVDAEPEGNGDDPELVFGLECALAEEGSLTPGWYDPAAWIGAEAQLGRKLVDAAVSVARLDERLRRMPEEDRFAVLERLALTEAADLLWAEGTRLRPERLALADRGRIGRTWDEAQAVARASWAVRRMTAGEMPLNTPAALCDFLGLHRTREPISGDEDLDRDALWVSGFDEIAAAEWCVAMSCLENLHPLTQAGAGYQLWRGYALSPPERLLEAAVIAARLGAGMGKGGIRAVPIVFANPRSLPLSSGGAAEKLFTWLDAASGAAGRAQLMLDRLQSWQARAEAETADMQGRSAPALVKLMAARPVLSARDVAEALDLSGAQARVLLDRLHRKGLVKELTGHERFRFWSALF